MPNWCDCTMVVTGEKEELKRFKETAKVDDDVLSEKPFEPYPEKWVDGDKLYDEYCGNVWVDGRPTRIIVSDARKKEIEKWFLKEFKEKPFHVFTKMGYSWCCEHWGSKWGICEAALSNEKDERKLSYMFQSPWSPPLALIQKMSTRFPALTFTVEYYECGEGFNGYVIYIGGVATKHKHNNHYTGHRGG